MRAGMRRWTLRAGRCVCALMVTAASIAEAQQSSVGGVVTDQATGQALEAARVVLVGPDRIELDGRAGLVFHVLQGFWFRFLVDAFILERRLRRARE